MASGQPQPPSLPAAGVVREWDVTDGVGRVALADGSVLRFGRSCCVDFEPIAGAQVLVEAVEPHKLGGFRASRMVVISLAQVDELLEARDAGRGVRGSIHLEPDEVLGTASEIGLVSVAFRELVGSRAALRELFQRSGAPGRLDFVPSPDVVIGPHRFQLLVSESPLPSGSYDATLLGGPKDLGRSVVTVCAGPFTIRRDAALTSRAPGQAFDVWDAWGLGDATRLAVALARLGDAVVVHQAGDIAFPVDEWIRLTGDLTRPDCRPFGAYVELGALPDRRSLATRGMQVWALPDVVAAAPRGLEDDAEFDAARDACLVACSHMVHAMHALVPGSDLWVMPGVQIGAYPMEQDPTRPLAGARRWRVEDSGDRVLLAARQP